MININFQGRVIPIEETAYELLKQYIESLTVYFAREEGRDEIINDIEGRIAELFSEKLKNGVSCITDADVNAIIEAMGGPGSGRNRNNGKGHFIFQNPYRHVGRSHLPANFEWPWAFVQERRRQDPGRCV